MHTARFYSSGDGVVYMGITLVPPPSEIPFPLDSLPPRYPTPRKDTGPGPGTGPGTRDTILPLVNRLADAYEKHYLSSTTAAGGNKPSFVSSTT